MNMLALFDREKKIDFFLFSLRAWEIKVPMWQELCHRMAWRLSEYNFTKQGLDHNPRFSTTVAINGLAFNTIESFISSKQAQNDVVRLSLDHFSTSQLIPNSIPKLSLDIQHVYKQQLLHYAQRRISFCLSTLVSGKVLPMPVVSNVR